MQQAGIQSFQAANLPDRYSVWHGVQYVQDVLDLFRISCFQMAGVVQIEDIILPTRPHVELHQSFLDKIEGIVETRVRAELSKALESHTLAARTGQEAVRDAMFSVAAFFSQIEEVRFVYRMPYREEQRVYVCLAVEQYDYDLMGRLLDIERAILDSHPDVLIDFYYPPVGNQEGCEFAHPKAECIYFNGRLPSSLSTSET